MMSVLDRKETPAVWLSHKTQKLTFRRTDTY